MNNKEQFIYDAYPIVLNYLNSKGLNGEMYAPYVLAQAALESGYGQSVSGNYNYFGMKAKKGDSSSSVATHEGFGGNRVKTSAQFTNFKSMRDGLEQGIERLLNDFGQFQDKQASPESWISHALNGRYGKYFTDDPNVYLRNFKGILNGSIINRIIQTYKDEHPQLGRFQQFMQQYMSLPHYENQNRPPLKNSQIWTSQPILKYGRKIIQRKRFF